MRGKSEFADDPEFIAQSIHENAFDHGSRLRIAGFWRL
jgi:hypothetical protein